MFKDKYDTIYFNKRSTDYTNMTQNNEKITALIEESNDPKDRAFLIVLQQINTSLIANTSTINDVAFKLNTHLDDYEKHSISEEALLNKGKGAWTIITWFIAILQGILVIAASTLYTDIKSLHITDISLDKRVTVLEVQDKNKTQVMENK